MNLLSEELKPLFEQKIALETYNSNLYLKIANFLSTLGLSKLSQYFKTQSADEISHRDKFVDFASARNCPVEILGVDAITENFSTLKEIAEVYLQRELETTKFITRMAFKAFEEEDLITYEFLINEMISEQKSEEQESLDFLDMVNNIGDDIKDWQLFDNTFNL